MKLDLPLMDNNITEEDINCLVEFLKGRPKLTQCENVKAFEEEWSTWLGMKYSVYVNSGASANLITMAALKYIYGAGGEIIVPTLTWVSDIASVLQNSFTPVFVDINPKNLCMEEEKIFEALSKKTKAVFITYVQGFNGLSDKLLYELEKNNIILIEDVCESHGATFKGKKLGSFGLASNFSFYFAHHMTTIEGGMVSTNDKVFYNIICMLRSHGLVRELKDNKLKQKYIKENKDLNPDFIFELPGYNVRGTEIGAVLGRSQLKYLDNNNLKRKDNFKIFLNNLDLSKYKTDFDIEGSCNYAFNLILVEKDIEFRDKLESAMKDANIEFRRGSSGGGNQLRQPYLKKLFPPIDYMKYPEVEHIHFYGYYIGNYPFLKKDKIISLCEYLNNV